MCHSVRGHIQEQDGEQIDTVDDRDEQKQRIPEKASPVLKRQGGGRKVQILDRRVQIPKRCGSRAGAKVE